MNHSSASGTAASAEHTLSEAKALVGLLNQKISQLERGGPVDFEQARQLLSEAFGPLQALSQPASGFGVVNPTTTQGPYARPAAGARAGSGISDLQQRRANQLLSELKLIETTLQRYERKAQRTQTHESQVKELLGSRSGLDRTDLAAADSLEEERKALLYTRKRIQQMNQESTGVLQTLQEQGRRLGTIGNNMGDMLESLGVSNTTILQIVRRNTVDAWIVYVGIIVLLFFLWYIW